MATLEQVGLALFTYTKDREMEWVEAEEAGVFYADIADSRVLIAPDSSGIPTLWLCVSDADDVLVGPTPEITDTYDLVQDRVAKAKEHRREEALQTIAFAIRNMRGTA